MSSEGLARLAQAGQLKAEPPSRKEFDRLLKSGRNYLADSRKVLSLESRFHLAYEAAYAFSLAALRRSGYRSENRYLVFQCLPHTLGLGPEHWRLLALCHERRNAATYKGIFVIDEKLLAELLQATELLLAKVTALAPPD
jgi:hypothetical protein